jgi:C4-dicarboxylate transporter DctM subunit
MISIFIFSVFLVMLLVLRVPIAFAMIISAASAIYIWDIVPINFLVQTVYTAGENFTLLAIPFFVLSGDLMLSGGLSSRLIDFGMKLFGRFNGALGMVTIFTCAIFAALSGSGPATAAAIGAIMIPAMVNDGYDKAYACTLAAVGGTLGPIIPPSIVFVVYASIAQVSIADMFLGGIFPGIFMALCLMFYVQRSTRKNKFGTKREEKVTPKELFISFKNAIWALLVPVIILGGIYGGVFTPTEAGVIACDYALIVGMFVYKEIKLKDILPIVLRSTLTCGTVLILVGCATTFSRLLSIERIPTMISNAILGVTDNIFIILLLINIVLFISGMFIDTTAAMLILTPLLLELCVPLGVDPVHLGILMCVNLVVGMVTPPMGVNLFITARVGGIGFESMVKWVIPMIGYLCVAILATTYIPSLSLFLPGLLK